MASLEQSVEMPIIGSNQDGHGPGQEEKGVGPNDQILPPSSPNARPACFKATWHEILFILVASMGVAIPSFLQGSTIVISSFAGHDLHMSTSEMTWMTASSALTSGSFLLLFGKLADLFGRRSMLLAGLCLFVLFAVATGFSHNGITLDVLNGVLGLASALVVPAAQGILGSVYERPSRRKNYAFACFSAGNPLGFVFGSVFSGIATQLFGWRASFWLLALVYAAVAVTAAFMVPVDDSEKLPLSRRTLGQFDIVGAALTIGGIGSFSTGISIAPDAPQGWKTPYVLAIIILGVVLMGAFVWWEHVFAHPLMPLQIWRDKEFTLLIVILFLGFMAFPPMMFFVALYLQNLFGYSALMTAVHMLPMVVSGIVVNVIAGLVLHSVSNKLLMALGAAAYTIAFLLVAIQHAGASYWAFTFPAQLIVLVGTEFEFNVANMYVVSSLPKSQQSIAGSIFQTVIKLSVTIGLGLSTGIYTGVAANPATTGYYAHDAFQPYAATFWFAMACAAVSIPIVPFLQIKTQGHEKPE